MSSFSTIFDLPLSHWFCNILGEKFSLYLNLKHRNRIVLFYHHKLGISVLTVITDFLTDIFPVIFLNIISQNSYKIVCKASDGCLVYKMTYAVSKTKTNAFVQASTGAAPIARKLLAGATRF